ncbi:MAG: hypothetical protein JST16_03090 [Bdellovibrionales bacterium]|nr:hypothetical protein [Bdellovibrionales bacterium]
MNGSRELFVRAKPSPGVAGTYDEHDLAVSRIVQALGGIFGPDGWLREIELRSGSLGPRFEILARNLARRVPDAAWSFGETARQTAAIEYERTLKSAKRIRGIVSHYEDRIECKFTSVFIVTDDPLVARAYQDSIRAFYSKVRFQIRPKSKVILLDEGWQRSAGLLLSNMNRLRDAVRSEIESAASTARKGIQEHGKVA